MRRETINYRDGELMLRGYLACDETQEGKRPGVLVMPGWLRLGPRRQKARRDARADGLRRARRDIYGTAVNSTISRRSCSRLLLYAPIPRNSAIAAE
jgi:hypothetical protein